MPDPGQRERETWWLQGFQIQGQSTGGELSSPIMCRNLLSSIMLYNVAVSIYTRNIVLSCYIMLYLIFCFAELCYFIIGIWDIVGYCGMVRHHIVYWCMLMLYIDTYRIILYHIVLYRTCFGFPRFSRWTWMVDVDAKGTLDLPFYRLLLAPGRWWQIEVWFEGVRSLPLVNKFEKVLLDQYLHGISHFLFGAIQFNTSWVFVGPVWTLPGPGQRERESWWPKGFQDQGQCKGGGTQLAHLLPNVLIVLYFYVDICWYIMIYCGILY